jgi:outer membrane protein assembly factor BamB
LSLFSFGCRTPAALLAAAIVALLIAALPGRAIASPTCKPAWSIYGGDLGHTRDASCATRFDGRLERVWTANEWGILEFPPTFSRGVIYLAQDNGRITAQDAATGRVLWSRFYGSEWSVSPTIWQPGGLLYIEGRSAGSLHVAGLYALSLTDGRVVWSARRWAGGESSPILISTPRGARLIAVNSAGYMGSFNPRTGASYWRRWIGAPATRDAASALPLPADVAGCPSKPTHRPSGGVHSSLSSKFTGSPAYANGTIYTANYAGDVLAVAWNGGLRWHVRNPHLSVYSSPAYLGGKLYLTSRLGWVVSLNASDGSQRWARATGGVAYGSPAVSRGAVYASSTNGVYWKLSAATGRVQWRQITGQAEVTSPVVVGSRVFFSHHGRCSNAHGSMVAYRTSTMKPVWRFNDGRYSPAIVAGRMLVVVGFGHLYGFRAR